MSQTPFTLSQMSAAVDRANASLTNAEQTLPMGRQFTYTAGIPAASTACLTPSILDDEQQLDREISMLRKRKEAMELRLQLAQLERGELTPAPVSRNGADSLPKMTILDMGRCMAPFTGSRHSTYDVHKFFADLEAIFATIQTTQIFRYMSLRSLLSETAGIFLTGCQAVTYDELKRALVHEFGQLLSTTELIEHLKRRTWKPAEESMHRYILTQRGLARRGNLPENELVGIIIDGLRLPLHDANLLVSVSPTLDALKEAIDRHESRILQNLKAEANRVNPRPGSAIAGNAHRYPTASQHDPAIRSTYYVHIQTPIGTQQHQYVIHRTPAELRQQPTIN